MLKTFNEEFENKKMCSKQGLEVIHREGARLGDCTGRLRFSHAVLWRYQSNFSPSKQLAGYHYHTWFLAGGLWANHLTSLSLVSSSVHEITLERVECGQYVFTVTTL